MGQTRSGEIGAKVDAVLDKVGKALLEVFALGVEEGQSAQAKLELQGRDRFMDELSDKLCGKCRKATRRQ